MNFISDMLKTKSSKINFIKGLIAISGADGKTDDDEKRFLINAAIGLDLNDEISSFNDMIKKGSSFEDADIIFENKREALFFIREAVQFCHIDGSYDNDEKYIINKIGKINGISDESIGKVEKWVLMGMDWKNEGEKILKLE